MGERWTQFPDSRTQGQPEFIRRAFGDALQGHDWNSAQWQERQRLRSVAEVLDVLGNDFRVRPEVQAGMERAAATFPVSVTPYYLSLARPEDPRDPILPQVLPDPAEVETPGLPDPFLEAELEVAPGLVHRYPDRALFLLTNYCATLCRHCMRKREWRRPFTRRSDPEVRAAVEEIARRPQIRDVLLSGGDPLNLGTLFLGRVLAQLRPIAHLDCIRFGSRVPVTEPFRVDADLLEVLRSNAPLFLNSHFNHAREITAEACVAIRRLTQAGVVVSNQAVLLRGVNDEAGALLDLSRALLRAGVRAYYLHHCDPVHGARHFRVGLQRGLDLVGSLAGRVSGLAIPRFVVDLPGGAGKVLADGAGLRGRSGDVYRFESPIDGSLVEVDGSEGGFGGTGSWTVVSADGDRYVPEPWRANALSDARSSNR